MQKKYQVFVSSTYLDLLHERQAVMHALLQLDCIPSGMELFPAADDNQWELIARTINECDYYVLILGGRYGSLDKDGQGYTEKEYRYAVDNGKPVISFLHRDPGSLQNKFTEPTDEGKKKLEKFREYVEMKACRYWDNSGELSAAVSVSLVQLIRNSPGVGWVRADSSPNFSDNTESTQQKVRSSEVQTFGFQPDTTDSQGALTSQNANIEKSEKIIKLLGLELSRQTTLYLPGIKHNRISEFPHPSNSEVRVTATNYPQLPYDMGFDDSLCALQLMPALSDLSHPFNVDILFDGEFEIDENVANVVTIGSPFSNKASKYYFSQSDLFFRFEGRSIVGKDKTIYSAILEEEAANQCTIVCDHALLSVFKLNGVNIAVLGGCRSYGQVIFTQILSDNYFISKLLSQVRGNEFQCLFPIGVTSAKVYEILDAEQLAIKEDGSWKLSSRTLRNDS